MGSHRGFRATQNPAGTWMSWALDPAAGRYAKRSPFRTKALALSDAKTRHARFLAKVETIARESTRRIADDYLTHLRTIKRRDDSHLANVERCLLGGNGKNGRHRDGLVTVLPDPAHARGRQMVEEWLAVLPLGAATKVQYLVTCKAMFNWAIPRGYVATNPVALAETVEPGQRLKVQYAVDDLRAIVRAINEPMHLRLCVLIYTGMRYDEAMHLRWEDIDFASRMIRVSADSGADIKRNKEREIHLQDELALLLEPHRQESGHLYPTSLHNPRRDLAGVLKRLGIHRKGLNFHSFRHSYSGIQTAIGVSGVLLKAYLGHGSESMTGHYAQRAQMHMAQTRGWPRGEFQLLDGWHTEWRCAWPRPA